MGETDARKTALSSSNGGGNWGGDGDDDGGLAPGTLFAGRFLIVRELGRGGWAEVYEVQDRALEDRSAALKVFPRLAPRHEARVRREIAALTSIQDPGVVRLLGSGQHQGRLYLVMELVQGRPFPRGSWEELRTPTLSLLETLARVHAYDVIHRDLKPDNLIVRDDGSVVLIDFGLAGGEALDSGLTQVGEVLGTLAYQAPEQGQGGPVDDRADVHAVGVMLYEALSGRLPRDLQDRMANYAGGRPRDPTPLSALAPGTPPMVVELVQRMLLPQPEERPSAAVALLWLRGEPMPEARPLPRLGDPGVLDALVHRLARGEVVTVGGPHGSGRTRLLADAAARLGEALWLVSSERPYGSLGPALGEPPAELDAIEVRAWVLQALASRGIPVMADDWPRLDEATRALLEGPGVPVGVARVASGHAELAPPLLTPEDLLPLFTGPERVLHARSYAAAELHRRTGGLARRVSEQLRAWQRAGVGTGEPGSLLLTRMELDNLAAETVPLTDAGEEAPGPLSAPLSDLLAWARLCWPNSTPALLWRVMGAPRWEVELLVEQALGRGLATLEDGRLRPRVDVPLSWTEDRRARAHDALASALPPGAEGRLRHLVAAGRTGELVDEALAVARAAEREGRHSVAAGALWTAWQVASDREPLAGPLLHALLAEGTVPSLDQARFVAQTGVSDDLAMLVEGAWRARQGEAAEADRLLTRIPPFEDPRLEMRRLSDRATAAGRIGPGALERLLLEIQHAPVITEHPEHLSQWESWLGQLRYNQSRFAEAGALQDRAAARLPAGRRLISLINAGRAWLEACALDLAEARAREALPLARAQRSARFEAEAEWILRSAASRRGATEPDLELVVAARELGDLRVLALVAFTEAMVARRGGRPEALALAREAQTAFEGIGNPNGALYAGALAFSLGGEGDVSALAERANTSGIPQNALDCLALLSERAPVPVRDPAALLAAFPEDTWDIVRGVYTPREALTRLGLLP